LQCGNPFGVELDLLEGFGEALAIAELGGPIDGFHQLERVAVEEVLLGLPSPVSCRAGLGSAV
jgi:hypothetical protein